MAGDGPPARCWCPKRGDQDPAAREQLGRSRGGFSTKLHVRVDGRGRPLLLLLSPGQSSDHKGFAPLVDGLQVRSGQRGRPRNRPRKIVADAANLAAPTAGCFAAAGSVVSSPEPVTTAAGDRSIRRPTGSATRWSAFFARIKQFRRMATLYEKLASHYLAIVTLAATVIWLRELA